MSTSTTPTTTSSSTADDITDQLTFSSSCPTCCSSSKKATTTTMTIQEEPASSLPSFPKTSTTQQQQQQQQIQKSPRKNKQSKNKNFYYDSIPLSVQPNMNETSNVLMHYTLSDLDDRANMNFWLALICLAVCAMNIVLLILNGAIHSASGEANMVVSHRTFHLMEFWTSHVYAITEAFALVTSPKTMLDIYSKPNLLKLLLFFNVVNSLVPALLITLDTEYFERISHELEYINEFTLSFITLILLGNLLKLPSENVNNNNNRSRRNSGGLSSLSNLRTNNSITSVNNNLIISNNDATTGKERVDVFSLLAGLFACGVGMVNLMLYNLQGKAEYAHYLEFSFNVATALITFWFCMDNRFVAQMEIGQILYGQHQNCSFCQIKNADFLMNQKQASYRWRKLYGLQQQRESVDEGTAEFRLLANTAAATPEGKENTDNATSNEQSLLLGDQGV